MPNLVETIQEIIKNTNNALSLADVLFGTVTSISPLKISVEQKLELSEEFLILTKNVKDYTVDVSMEWTTEIKNLNANHNHSVSGDVSVNSNASINPNPENIEVLITNNVSSNFSVEQKNINLSHNHEISGTKSITIHNALQVGDKVILLQQMGRSKICSIR